jgi:hypothetical protein
MTTTEPIAENALEKIDELRTYMEKEGEDDAAGQEEPEGVMSLHVKLTHKQGDAFMWAIPSEQDWLHDALDDFRIVAGVVYAEDEPLLPGSIEIDGYFQADEDGRWVHVSAGRVEVDPETQDACWKNDLNEFPEVVAQLNRALEVPEYRHAVEKAAIGIYA